MKFIRYLKPQDSAADFNLKVANLMAFNWVYYYYKLTRPRPSPAISLEQRLVQYGIHLLEVLR